jgi:hypothetical protein
MPFTRSSLILFVLCFAVAGFAEAQTAKVMTVSDEGSELFGETRILDYHGDLPGKAPAGRDIPQMPNWPKTMGSHVNFKPSRGLVLADMNQDGTLEIVASSTDSKIYVWDHTGAILPGFPKTTIGWCQRPPSVADLDGDGDMEIVQFTRGMTSGGRFYIVDHEGNTLAGFPVNLGNNNISATPAIYDLDNDGDLEILVPERAYPIGYLHVFEYDGTEWGGRWPVALDHVPTGTAAVGDVNNDGGVEIVYLSYNSIYVLDTGGMNLAGWPKQIANANFSYQSAALADLDHDDDLEIVVGAHKDAAGCYIFHHDGTPFPGWPKMVNTWTYCPPTVVDLDADGEFEIIDGRAGFVSYPSECFWVWDAGGNVRPGFPYVMTMGGGSEGPLTVADINNDGLMEIFADYNMASAPSDGDIYIGYLFGVDSDCNDLPGFPLRPNGFTYMNGASIADVDGDGDYELGLVSVWEDTAYVNLYDLEGEWHPSEVAWETYHKKNQRGGLSNSEDKLNFQGHFGIGESVKIYVPDEPGYKAYLWAALGAKKTFTFNYGWFHLDPSPILLTVLYNNTIPPAGEIVFNVNVPDDPALSGAMIFLQGLTGADPGPGDGVFTNMLEKTIQ